MKFDLRVIIPSIGIILAIATFQINLSYGQNWEEFGVFLGPIQRHTGVFHNENGVFIPWKTICTPSQAYLLQPCNSLISPDGTLTSSGNTAVNCITNGAILTALGGAFNLPVDSIKGILGALATPTGCSGIVDLDLISKSPDIQRLVQFAGSMAGSEGLSSSTAGPGSTPSGSGTSGGSAPHTNETAVNPAVITNQAVIIAPGSSSEQNEKFFDPVTVTITRGSTVTWRNDDSTIHTVTSGSAQGGESGTLFDSMYMTSGKTFSWKFENAGNFDYYCTLHPYMHGTIIVN